MEHGDFYCDCPFCNAKISAPAELKNTLADCPVCKRNIMLVDRTNSKATQSISAVTTPATNPPQPPQPPQPPPAAPVSQKSQIAETEKEETTIWQSIFSHRVEFDDWDEPQPQKTENSTSSSNQQEVKLTAVQDNSSVKRCVDDFYDELVKKQPEYLPPWIVIAGYFIAFLSLMTSLAVGASTNGIGYLGLVPTLFTFLGTACVDRFFRENHYMLYDQRKIIVILERMLFNMENGKK